MAEACWQHTCIFLLSTKSGDCKWYMRDTTNQQFFMIFACNVNKIRKHWISWAPGEPELICCMGMLPTKRRNKANDGYLINLKPVTNTLTQQGIITSTANIWLFLRLGFGSLQLKLSQLRHTTPPIKMSLSKVKSGQPCEVQSNMCWQAWFLWKCFQCAAQA